MATRMQQRRGTAAQWVSTNSGNGPILNAGEIGYETDTNKFKIGDGTNHWINLDYFIDANSTVNPSFGSSIVFEGATANAFETTVQVTDPTADRTITLPDATGTVVLADGSGNVTVSGDLTVSGTTTTINSTTINATTGIVFEGLTANAFETTLSVTDPTADRTLTLPDSTGTLATESYVDTAASNATFDASLAAGTGLDWNATTDQFDIDSTVATKTYANDAVSTHSSDTTMVHGIADTSVLATTTDISNHNSDSTDVHGIANTADLVTTSSLTSNLSSKADLASPTFSGNVVLPSTTSIGDVSSTEIGYVNGVTSAIQTQIDAKASSTDLSNHSSDTTSIHGIADTSLLVTTTGTQTLTGKTLESPTLTGTVTLPNNTISQAMMGDDSVGTNEIGGLAVTEGKIAASAVTEGKIADGAVTSVKIADGTIVNADINVSAAIAQSKVADLTTDLAAKLALAGGTMTGSLTLSGAPTSDLHAATKLYVDNVTAGINFHQAVHVATTTNLSADYSNGTGGIGATLTASANAAWPTIDGHSSFTQYDRILVKNQTDAKQNGIYILSDLGSAGSKWILTRASDADNNPTGEMKTGDFVLSLNGGQSGYGFVNNSTTNPIAIGTDNITYTEFNAAKTIVAGNGLQEATPGTLSIDTAVTATKASVDLKAPIDAPTFTGTVTVAASGIAFTDGTQTKQGVASLTPIIQKSDSYTLSSLTERDSLIEVAKSTATTITIPLNSTIAYPVGTSIDILQTSTGQVTIAGAAGVTVNATPGLKLRTQWSSATLFKRAENTWIVMGDLAV